MLSRQLAGFDRQKAKRANPDHGVRHATVSPAPGFLQRTSGCACGGDCPRCRGKYHLQAKLEVSQPGDALEQEADRVAEQVLRTPEPASRPDPAAQEIRRLRLSRHSFGNEAQTPDVPPAVRDAIASPSQPLDPSTRIFMEERFGHDFSRVRVHSAAAAERSALDVNANAYTVGRDIVFGAGQFAPQTHAGRRLIAHELTHVLQQSGVDAISAGQSNGKRGLSSVSAGLSAISISAGGRNMLRRQPLPEATDPKPEPQPPAWNEHLNAILPKGVGPVAHIDQVMTLIDVLGEAELGRIVELIFANDDARALVATYGVPGIIALHQTLTGPRPDVLPDRLDVPAARLLLTLFPSRTPPADPSKAPADPSKPPPEIFPAEAVREAYVRFHKNALLDREDEQGNAVRQNCIIIVRNLVPQLFAADPKRAGRISAALGKLSGKKLTMPDVGAELVKLGVAAKPIPIPFKDGNGNKDAPTSLDHSAWDDIVKAIGDVRGWHVFGVSLMDGYHSVTLFIDNSSGDPQLYWADQWAIAGGEDFGQESGAISGFRRYDDPKKFDRWIEEYTNSRWKQVHSPDSKCGKKNPKTWKSSCKYEATLKMWHLRTVPE
jgi:uncharacterized protein DUF4157